MKLKQWIGLLCLLLIVTTASACTSAPSTGTAAESSPEATAAVTETAEPEPVASAPSLADLPAAAADLPVLQGKAVVEMVVNGGRIVMEVDGTQAPVTAGNFVDLVQRGVYDGVVFHRVVKSPEPFVVQGGDPQSKDPAVPPQLYGTGGFTDPDTQEERLIPLEIQPEGADAPIYSQTFPEAGINAPPALKHTRGALAMARSQLADSASAQFYFALADLPFLDGNYAVFGYVTEGMDVVDAIEQGDVVESATVVSGIENLKQPE